MQFREKFFCDKCDHVTVSIACLNAHKKSAHCIDGTKYECHCGKQFTHIGSFTYHKKYSHGNYQIVKNHICTICEKAYEKSSALKVCKLY